MVGFDICRGVKKPCHGKEGGVDERHGEGLGC